MSNNIKVRAEVDHANYDSFIKEYIFAAVGKILRRCEREYNAKYSDQTALILYNKCEQFSKEIADIVSAENINPEVDIFGVPVNYNYFNQQRQF